MKLNQEKCHFLVSGHKHENVWAKIEQNKIWKSRKQRLLGVEIDNSLNIGLYISRYFTDFLSFLRNFLFFSLAVAFVFSVFLADIDWLIPYLSASSSFVMRNCILWMILVQNSAVWLFCTFDSLFAFFFRRSSFNKIWFSSKISRAVLLLGGENIIRYVCRYICICVFLIYSFILH